MAKIKDGMIPQSEKKLWNPQITLAKKNYNRSIYEATQREHEKKNCRAPTVAEISQKGTKEQANLRNKSTWK